MNKFPFKQRPAGFTLIEILIALFIFAIMATMATVALRRIYTDKKILDQHVQEMNELQLATAMLRLDISQMIDRPVRSQQGSLSLAVSGTHSSITFTRTGNINPLGYFPISHLQRIQYTGGSALSRSSWNILDLAPASQSSNKVLLPTIQKWRISYYDDNLKKYAKWPQGDDDTSNADSSGKKKKNPLPRAVEIQFIDSHFGSVDLFIPIFAGNLHIKEEQEETKN